MSKKQPPKRRLLFRTRNSEHTPQGFVAAIELVDVATDEVVWQREGFVKRVGPLRYDNSVMRKQRRELLSYLKQHPETELCDLLTLRNP